MTVKNSPTPVKVHFDPEPLREKLGMRKGEFAALVGLSNNGYSGLINNPHQVRMETMAKIISVTGCKIEDLFRVEPSA